MRNLHFLSIIVLKKKAGEIEQLGGEQRAQQRVVSRNSNEAIGQCASRLLDDPRRLVSPYTPLHWGLNFDSICSTCPDSNRRSSAAIAAGVAARYTP